MAKSHQRFSAAIQPAKMTPADQNTVTIVSCHERIH